MKKITRAYVTHFDECIMKQVLPNGRSITCNWIKDVNGTWKAFFSTDSVYHICAYSGLFKDCFNCECYDDDSEAMVKKCKAQGYTITSQELADRATDCLNAEGCTVKFRSIDV